MWGVRFSVCIFVLFAGVMHAQTNADATQKAIDEVTKIEKEKIPVLVTSGPAAADWFDSHNAEDLAYQDPDAGVLTKEQVSAQLRAGTRKPSSIKQYDHRVRVYANGEVAVVTYLGDVIGKKSSAGETLPFTSHEATTDVWVKQDGAWKRVVHSVTRIPKQ